MNLGRKLLKIGAFILAAYFLTYAFFRATGEFIRLEIAQAEAIASRYHITAISDEWHLLEHKLIEEIESVPLHMRALLKLRQSRVPMLNHIFWPLRKAEAAFWNVVDQ